MNNIAAIKIKQARQHILHNLNMVYPSGLTVKSLYQTVCSIDLAYDFNLFTRDIAYLKDKGYIFFIDDCLGGMEFARKVAKLTCQGKEIAESTMKDAALEI